MDGPIIDRLENARVKAKDYLRAHDFFKVESYESSLDNKIHRIFAHSKFLGFTAEAYTNMRPALQLASYFIQNPRIIDYFLHQMQSKAAVVTWLTSSLAYYKPNEGREQDPRRILKRRNSVLKGLAYGLDWHTLDANVAPKNMDMGMTFWFKSVRTAYVQHATKDQTDHEVSAASNGVSESKKLILDQGKSQAQDMNKQPFKYGKPAVLLHPFFANYFHTAKAPSEMSDDEKLQRLAVRFELAGILVHELAHCLNVYPEVKCWDPEGGIRELHASEEEAAYLSSAGWDPECGLSWEMSIFGRQVVRFTNFGILDMQRHWQYSEAEELAVPVLEDLENQAQAGTWACTVEGKPYRTSSNCYDHRRTLVPWQWIANWFQKDHWHKDRQAAEIKALPVNALKMRYEIPDPEHQASRERKIVRIEIEAPPPIFETADWTLPDESEDSDSDAAGLEGNETGTETQEGQDDTGRV